MKATASAIATSVHPTIVHWNAVRESSVNADIGGSSGREIEKKPSLLGDGAQALSQKKARDFTQCDDVGPVGLNPGGRVQASLIASARLSSKLMIGAVLISAATVSSAIKVCAT